MLLDISRVRTGVVDVNRRVEPEAFADLTDDFKVVGPTEIAGTDRREKGTHVVLHSRTQYEDWPEPARRRHLLRPWLRTPAFAVPPPVFADRNRDMLAWQRPPRAPGFRVSGNQAGLG